MTAMRLMLRTGFDRVERWFEYAFAPECNPLKQLGALGWFFYWIVTVSGIYLYIFFDSGVTQAYDSVEYLTHVQWYAGGVMRSLHRYASDALVVVMVLHLVREYLKDRFRDARWFTWVIGVAMIWFVYASGITGYWVVWDKFAQYIAIVTTEWLDALSFFGKPIARNVLHDTTLSGRFFTLLVFIHIAVPLTLLLLMWIHIQRLSNSKVNPPLGLALGSMATLIVLSFAKPALSQGPAHLNVVPSQVDFDWFYFTIYPLLDRMSGINVWFLLVGASLLLLAAPWLHRRPALPVAQVDLENCNGCGRCVADCPYSAVTLAARSDGRPFEHEVIVNASLCVGCGICAGACPTSTPYRRRSELKPGIDLPTPTIAQIRGETLDKTAVLAGDRRVLIYGCDMGPDVKGLERDNVAVVRMPCIGAFPPSFIDYAVSRGLADGVLLVGCGQGDCHHRLGIQWTEQRIARERDPQLRERLPRERLACCWAAPGELARVQNALDDFLADLGEIESVGAQERGRARCAADMTDA